MGRGGQQKGTRHQEEVASGVTAPPGERSPEAKERHDKLSDDVDALLDEIDGVLESNAEEFVKGYVQKGGQ